jgi:D-alanine-D-alanine ligase
MFATMKVAVLMGGPSREHDVSLKSGAQVLAALGDRGLPVRIERDRRWTIGGEPASTIGRAIDRVKELAGVAFIALHGPFGEDGTIQGFLDTCGLPYTGSGPAASGLAMDKIRTKRIYAAHGLPTEPSVSIAPYDDRARALARIEAELGFPCVVKPACDGSSFGVSFPADRAALEEAVAEHLAKGSEILVERYVRGVELTCGVLEDGAQGRTFALPVTEIVPADRYAFFDYEAKYTPGATREITPARIPDAVRDAVQSIALAAHRALGCRDFSRSDFMLAGERPVILETNTIPGLTETSLLPQAAAAAGIDFPSLIRMLVDNARRRA